MEFIKNLVSGIPGEFSIFLKCALLVIFCCVILGLLGRFIFGKRSTLNQSISSAIGILFVYAATIALYSLGARFERFIAPLPFIDVVGEELTLFCFQYSDYTVICTQVLHMIILAFIANCIECLIPTGKGFGWIFYRSLTVVLAMFGQLLVCWLIERYLPAGLVTYAPTILLFLMLLLLAVGSLKFLVGALLVNVSPVVAAFYTFFFASLVGKQLTKAIYTSLILSLLVYGLTKLGIITISIAASALLGYIPLLFILLALWWLVDKYL